MTNLNTTRRPSVSFELKDVTFNFPHLGKAWMPQFANGGDRPQWSVQACGLDAESAQDLRELGVTVSETDNGLAVNLKAYTHNAQGVPTDFEVFDAEGEILTEEQRSAIGYGSKGHINGYLYRNSYGTVSARLDFVVVTELVERQTMTKQDRAKRMLGLVD